MVVESIKNDNLNEYMLDVYKRFQWKSAFQLCIQSMNLGVEQWLSAQGVESASCVQFYRAISTQMTRWLKDTYKKGHLYLEEGFLLVRSIFTGQTKNGLLLPH